LLDRLRSADNAGRKAMCAMIGRFGAAGKAAAPGLAGALRSRDATVREAAVEALERIGPSAAPVLADVARDESEARTARLPAIRLLARWAPPARETVTALQSAAGGKDPDVRAAAREALGRLAGPPGK
jgi:HEAT repeat protein